MRRNFKPQPLLYPQPVLIIAAYGENDLPNAMNAAWGGLCGEDEIFMCLSPTHKTVKNILERKAFTVSMGEASQAVRCDYVGVESGNKVPDKMAKSGFHTIKSDFVDAPLIEELGMAFECELKSYDPDSHFMIGKVVNISVDERVMDTSGQIDIRKVNPILLEGVNDEYLELGNVVGKAFYDGKALK